MKKRIKIIFVVFTFILIAVLGEVMGLIFHELGHALMATYFKIPVNEFHIGVLSYVEINIAEITDFQFAMISLGSIILPEVIYLLLMVFKNPLMTAVRVFSGVLLYVTSIFNIGVILIGTEHLEEWDILLFQKYSGVNSTTIIIAMVLLLIVNITLEIRRGGIKHTLICLADRLE